MCHLNAGGRSHAAPPAPLSVTSSSSAQLMADEGAGFRNSVMCIETFSFFLRPPGCPGTAIEIGQQSAPLPVPGRGTANST
jgi:hypothetical protein